MSEDIQEKACKKYGHKWYYIGEQVDPKGEVIGKIYECRCGQRQLRLYTWYAERLLE